MTARGFHRHAPGNRSHRGAAAVVMIVLLVILGLIVVTMLGGAGRDHDLTVQRIQSVQAFYAAEAGLNMGIRELVVDQDEDGDGGIGSISDDGNAANNPQLGSAQVLVTTQTAGLQVTLTSEGTRGTSTRRIDSEMFIGSSGTTPGLIVYRHEYTGPGEPGSVNDIDWDGSPTSVAVVSCMNYSQDDSGVTAWPGGPSDRWGQRFVGRISVPSNGTWTFYTNSDDGSRLWINGTMVVDNDGQHSMQTRSGTIVLTAGLHDIEVKWYERYVHQGLIVSWSGPTVPSQTVIPASAFFH